MKQSSEAASPPPVDVSQECADGREEDDAGAHSQFDQPHSREQPEQEQVANTSSTSHPAATRKDSPTDETVLTFKFTATNKPEPSPEEAGDRESVSHKPAELHQAEGSQHQTDSSTPSQPQKPKPLLKPKPAASKPAAPFPSSSKQSSPQEELPVACVIKDPPSSPVVAESAASDTKQGQLLASLLHQAGENDYYSLLGASPGAGEGELARCRRERNQELHPDHFMNDPEGRTRLVAPLVEILFVSKQLVSCSAISFVNTQGTHCRFLLQNCFLCKQRVCVCLLTCLLLQCSCSAICPDRAV